MSNAPHALHERSDEGSGSVPVLARQGQILGGTYRLLGRIGAGGMAEVYAAEHIRLGRHFAVKVLRRDEGPKALSRFRREARAVARIRNDFVVDVVDSGEADGTPYLVMELLAGEDLRSLLSTLNVLPIQRAVNLIWEACQGVAAVHQAGLVHRDLKPENLFVSRRSTGEDWCKILDFGIAKSELSGSTTEGALIGTVRYMAPEQLQDGASAGPSVDVYALGAVLYELLSGSCLHSAVTVQELMFKVLNAEPVRLEKLRKEVPTALADAVHRAVALEAHRRFADVQEFARAIAPFSSIEARDAASAVSQTLNLDGAVVQSGLPARRGRGPLLLGVLLSVVGGFLIRGLVPSGHAAAVSVPPPVPALPVPSRVAAQSSPSPSSSAATPAAAAKPASVTPAGVAPARLMRKVVALPAHPGAPALRPALGAHTATFDNENPYPR